MQIVRTIAWVLILFAILAFSFFNWRPVEVMLWDNMVLETKVPALVIIAFLLGLVPTWLYHRSVRWTMSRRIRTLESSVKSAALAHWHDPEATTPGDDIGSADTGYTGDNPGDKPAETGDNLTLTAPAIADTPEQPVASDPGPRNDTGKL